MNHIIPFAVPQPEPIQCLVARMPDPWGGATAITRTWDNGDEARCRLCDHCGACDGVCLVIVPGRVRDDEAPLYSIAGFGRRSAGA